MTTRLPRERTRGGSAANASATARYLAAADDHATVGSPLLEPDLAAQRLVAEVMTRGVVSAHEDAAFKQIVAALVRNDVSAVPVVDDEGHVVGVVSESDLLARVSGGIGAAPRGHRLAARRETAAKSRALTARDLMTSPAVTVAPHTTIVEAARIAAHHRIHRLPVVESTGELVGIVTRGDLLLPFLRPDKEILDEIHEYLKSGLVIDPSSLDLGVTEGVVTVSGQLDRQMLVEQLVTHVEGITGVVGLIDQLTARFDDRLIAAPRIGIP